MPSLTYVERRSQIEDYFDRTAVHAWSRLTSDAPINRIRAIVRSGRDEMRRTLLGWLPANLDGCRVLDAGCGTGAFAVEAARRGAAVVAVDLSPTLIALARTRAPSGLDEGTVTFVAGDMLAADLGHFDHVVAMDSLIHYASDDAVAAVAGLAVRARRSVLFTFAPRTPALALLHAIGRLFPRANRAPAIEPIAERSICHRLESNPMLKSWQVGRGRRVQNTFYTSQAVELVRA
jgi:magnesium-protoporphyrin O-methyltransferase